MKIVKSDVPEDYEVYFDFTLTAEDMIKADPRLENAMRMLRDGSPDIEIFQSPGRYTYHITGHAIIGLVEMCLHDIARSLDREVQASVPSA